jgi:hypothetical protein
MDKALVIIVILLGEAVAISAEMAAARNYFVAQQSFVGVFLKVIPVLIVGAALLIIGYMLGFAKFKNIWIVSAVSTTSILILEPVLAYVFTNQMPTRGPLLGLILGFSGFLAALFL